MTATFGAACFATAALITGGCAASQPRDTEPLSWNSVWLDVQTIRAAGTTFAWAELGSGSPLLLLNGTASPMNEWDPALLAELAAQHRVIIFDYPGLGASGEAPSTWNFDSAADWVSDFLSQVSPGAPVDLLGWSMGGFIAQRLAVRHPTDVRALVLAGTNPGGSQAVLGPQWVQDIDSNPSSEADYLRTNYPDGEHAAGQLFLQRLTEAIDSGAYPESENPDATRDAMVAAEDPWLESDTNISDLHRITIPTLVITGSQDIITPPINSRRMAALIPGARLVLVPNAGHSFVFQEPAAMAALITDFLTSARTR
jgi:pimeloyl-ACP methyl ester carboxylesterase